ncbi:MAG: thioredoxin-disulfide reductase [Candidatus Krumholzibacteriota bacterium]|nr:thioredoxin-disulfide reductase [Candidatus Krumholzibacteriota bacterium]
MYDVAIIGSGPAGLTAAIYTSRSEMKTVVFEGMSPGGQLMITTEVENFPGFPEGVQGPELMEKMKEQASKFKAEINPGYITEVEFNESPFVIKSGSDEVTAKTVIIATGSTARWLGIDSESKLRGKGVSACATCDGFFFKDRDIAVVGGGDSAIEEADFLTRFASKVTIIHRRDELRASEAMQKKAFDNEKIDIAWNSTVEEILDVSKDKVTGIKLKNVKTDEKRILPVEGVFLAIGYDPATDIFKGKIEMDKKNYIVTKENTQTSVPGVFAAGDVRDFKYRQAVTAAGDGCMAAIDAYRWLGGTK